MPNPPEVSRWKYLKPADLKRFKNLQFAAKLVVEGYFQGKHRSPFYDFSAEFADYRPYSPGDEIRSIDWKAYARTDRYYVKLSRKETDMNCVVLVDKSSSMAFRGQAPISKLDYASYLAASLSYLMIKQGDKVGMAVCDDLVRGYVPPGGTTQALYQSLSLLERIKPGGPTSLSLGLQLLSGMVKRRGLLIVISDFLDDTDKIFKALSMYTHRGFAVLLFHVMTDDEMNLPDSPNALFYDPESPLAVPAEPDSIRKAYQDEMKSFIESMDSKAKARRIHYHLSLTSEPYHKALDTFLTARGRF